jgi:monovalent cation:H+ antiporter-2, CPA2 family
MAGAIDPTQFKEAFIVLVTASVVIPVFMRLKLSPVVGFLAVGMLVGPSGLGALAGANPWLEPFVIYDRERISFFAELGVVFLLFMIGLELSFERLKMMRTLVFGLGTMQVAMSTAAIAGAALLFGLQGQAALVVGLALAMSSSAVIIQVLSERRKMTSPVGRTTFSVLVFQDLAVVPVLFGVAMLGAAATTGGAAALTFAAAMAQAALAVLVCVVLGRLFLRPLFRMVGRTNSPELFMAACFLVVLSASVGVALAGLSMALGALIAGIMLAETEYRRQIEVLIEPFKGLLVGVFLVSIGMTIDLASIAAQPLAIAGAALGLVVVKAGIVVLLAQLFRLPVSVSLPSGLLLGAGSEFSFVILAAGTSSGVLPAEVGAFALIIAALTMASIPFLAQLGGMFEKRRAKQEAIDPAFLAPVVHDGEARVIIAGYGRVGQLVSEMLDAHKIAWMAADTNVDAVARARRAGKPVYFGDVSQPAFLHRSGLGVAPALVVTMDSVVAVEAVVSAARAERADLTIVARARDARHAASLYRKGASDAVPETIEASLLLAETLLADIGVPMGYVIASIHDKRAALRAEIQGLAGETPEPVQRPKRRLKQTGG